MLRSLVFEEPYAPVWMPDKLEVDSRAMCTDL